MSGHTTKEPWEWQGDNYIEGADYSTVMEVEVECMAHCYGGMAEVTISKEDRALIAASPDLLHAAKAALGALTRNHNDEVQGDFDLASGYGLDDEVRWLEEAIQKAEGA